jgi:hypothetical protein
MRRTVGAVALAAAVGLGISLVPPSASQAATEDTMFIYGLGTIAEGVPCNTCTIDIEFSAVVAGAHAGVYGGTGLSCSFNGGGSELLTGGSGGGILSGCGMEGNVYYDRVGSVMTLSGTICIDSYCGSIATTMLSWVPTSFLPTTSFILSGVVMLDDGLGPAPTLPPTPEVTVPPLPTAPPSSSCNVVDTAGICVDVAPGPVQQTVALASPQPSGSLHVVGRVDLYSVPLPTGGTATFPCVVLGVDATDTGGCGVPGATRVGTVATLVDTYASGGTPAVTVGICEATITATVVGFGVQNVPGSTLC